MNESYTIDGKVYERLVGQVGSHEAADLAIVTVLTAHKDGLVELVEPVPFDGSFLTESEMP